MSEIIQAERVSFSYGKRHVLKGVSFALEQGEILGVLGPNGSGKTTLLKVIDGVLSPQWGRVLLDGVDVSTMKRREVARRVAVLPQESHIPFPLTVNETVLMGRAPHLRGFGFERKKDLEVAEEAMQLTNTRDVARRYLGELSGGERQRVIMARALAQEPLVLLLDEPTSHLDISHQVEMVELLSRLNRERGLTVLNISHDLNLAAQYCHRVLMLGEGEVKGVGPPAGVITAESIRELFRVEVLVDRNPLTGSPRVTPLGGMAASDEGSGGGTPLHQERGDAMTMR